MRRDAARGITAGGDRLTVAEWLEEWLEKEVHVRPRTLDSYRMMVNRHLIPALGRHRLRKLEARHVRDYLAEKREQKLAARTVQYHHAILRRALRVAESHGLIDRNVARLVTPPPVRRAEVVPLSTAQAKAFLEAIRGDRLEALYKVAMATGLRQSELLGLTWSDIDFDEATLAVRQTLQRYGGAFHLDEPKTTKSRRTLALATPVVDALREQRDRQIFDKALTRELWDGNEWNLVFTRAGGAPLSGFQVTRHFQTILARCGLPKVRFHDLRHGAATFLLAAGIDLKVVQDILGHSTIATTADTYAHVMPELKRDAAERIGAKLFG